MTQSISMVTLAVADVARARGFYEALGWRAAPVSKPEMALFALGGGVVLALFEGAALATDAGLAAVSGAGETRDGGSHSVKSGDGVAVVLSHNVAAPEGVDAVLQAAAAAGGQVTTAAQRAEWGGWHGAFRDLDGHLWEVAHNPYWGLRADGALILPDDGAAG